MKKALQFLLFAILSCVLANLPTTTLKAAHAVGGELTYECFGGEDFLIHLSLYRDCNCTGCAHSDEPA